MKLLAKTTLAVILALASVGTFAQAATAPALPLISLFIGGGMPGPNGPTSRMLSVLSDGSVTETIGRYPRLQDLDGKPTKTTKVIMKIQSADVMANITRLADNLKGGDLQLVNPQQPQCEDASNLIYQVLNNGKFVDVASNRGCRPYQLVDENQREDAARVRVYLDAIDQLSR